MDLNLLNKNNLNEPEIEMKDRIKSGVMGHGAKNTNISLKKMAYMAASFIITSALIVSVIYVALGNGKTKNQPTKQTPADTAVKTAEPGTAKTGNNDYIIGYDKNGNPVKELRFSNPDNDILYPVYNPKAFMRYSEYDGFGYGANISIGTQTIGYINGDFKKVFETDSYFPDTIYAGNKFLAITTEDGIYDIKGNLLCKNFQNFYSMKNTADGNYIFTYKERYIDRGKNKFGYNDSPPQWPTGLFDLKTGKFISPPDSNERIGVVIINDNVFARIMLNTLSSNYSFYNKNGEPIKELNDKFNKIYHWYDYDDMHPASDKNDKWGFIDNNFNWVIKPQYDSVNGFYKGMAIVVSGSEHKIIDRNGKPVNINDVLTKFPVINTSEYKGYKFKVPLDGEQLILMNNRMYVIFYNDAGEELLSDMSGNILSPVGQFVMSADSDYQFQNECVVSEFDNNDIYFLDPMKTKKLYAIDKSGNILIFDEKTNEFSSTGIKTKNFMSAYDKSSIFDLSPLEIYDNFTCLTYGEQKRDDNNICTDNYRRDIYNSAGKKIFSGSYGEYNNVTYDGKYIWVQDDKYCGYIDSQGKWLYREEYKNWEYHYKSPEDAKAKSAS